jgi:hypothetical protein
VILEMASLGKALLAQKEFKTEGNICISVNLASAGKEAILQP